MYIETVPNRNSPPAILLRESFREDGNIKKRTLANLTDWPKELIEGFRTLLKGGTVIAAERDAVSIRRSLPHGHVAAALGTLRATELDRILGPAGADQALDLESISRCSTTSASSFRKSPPPRCCSSSISGVLSPAIALSFEFRRKTDAIAEEAALDGIYAVRTSLPAELLDDTATVKAYKSLSGVERALRSIKTTDIEIRPICHWASPRVKAHVMLCMLAYYVEHHMRAKLAPLLYDDTDREAAAALRNSVVAKAQRSPAARRKETTGLTSDGLPVQRFQSLLADLATYCRLQATTALNDNYVFTLYSRPNPTQARAFELLGIKPDCTQ